MELITDRTLADVTRAQQFRSKGWNNLTVAEQAEWSAGLKGAYNYTDLNRVESAVATLRAKLAAEGYPIELEATRVWTKADIPTVADMERYLANVRAIRKGWEVKATTPQVPGTMAGLNYEGANAIEQVLMDVEQLLENMVSAFVYSSDIFMGEL